MEYTNILELDIKLEHDRDLMISYLITNGHMFIEEAETATDRDLLKIILNGLICDGYNNLKTGIKLSSNL